jgi:hypothetical protein
MQTVSLENRGLLKISGSDAKSFLQSQFSNDIDSLKKKSIQINAYCQHQGRIIAIIWVMKKLNDYFLSFPLELKDILIKRLKMFVIIADVLITDFSEKVKQIAIIGKDFQHKNIFKLNNEQSILLDFDEEINSFDTNKIVLDDWELCCIKQKLAEVYLSTTEKFIPQMLNLDINEQGVSFSKGCYPGQEIIARLHYLGKAKRRMYRFESSSKVKVNDEIMISELKPPRSSGIVVRCVGSNFLATFQTQYNNEEIFINNNNKITKIYE